MTTDTDIRVEHSTPEQLQGLGVRDWPIWTKEPSTFDWTYAEQETCYLLEGQVTVTSSAGTVQFGAGDLVTFPRGLRCTWQVRQAVRKHYRFG